MCARRLELFPGKDSNLDHLGQNEAACQLADQGSHQGSTIRNIRIVRARHSGWTRTTGHGIMSSVLYQLSYRAPTFRARPGT